MSNSFIRGELHIFTDDPYTYLPLIDEKEIHLMITYTEVCNAIEKGQKKIYTTQLYFLSHMWIKAGYDIYLYDNSYVIKFDDNYLDFADLRYNQMHYYYMQDLYRFNELYQSPE